jgi:polygalacturonase
MKQNNFKFDDYVEIYKARGDKPRINTNLQVHKGIISKITMKKNMLTGTHTKYKVSADWSICMSLFADIPSIFSIESPEEDNQQKNTPTLN